MPGSTTTTTSIPWSCAKMGTACCYEQDYQSRNEKLKHVNKASFTGSLTGHYCVHLHQKLSSNIVLYGDTNGEKGSVNS
jgi:hypothetical protein